MTKYIYYIIIINIISFSIYGLDKYLAKKQKSRISERVLIISGILGGPLGALIGMQLFHHKTRKLRFYLLNIFFLIIWLYLSYRFYIVK